MNSLLVMLLTIGIILIKIFWINTEIRYFKNRLNFEMFKTNFIELVILVSQIFVVYYFPLPRTPYDFVISSLGIIMYVLGMGFAVWARITMNKVWGVPGEFSQNQTHFVTTGPFQISRNPIYLGFIFIYFGFAIAINSWLIFLRIPLLIYFYKAAKIEEKILEKKFGKKYLTYKSKTPRFLLGV
ncbi:MAG TPA: isoprenylcysteine carboxylmethyltransferase family protein [Candidatus Limnocylindrales bacterium]|nr:isoprenylcysteine carboxylmethyltransferase family protein [Candidatus Limnocylindrales bacterium]